MISKDIIKRQEEFESQTNKQRMPSPHWVVTERDFSSFTDVITTRLSLINLHALITPHFQISSVREKKIGGIPMEKYLPQIS